MPLRPKIECEVCGNKEKAILHRHHILERGKIGSTNDDWNIAIICANCHNLIHNTERLKIIGVFPGTKPPSGKILVYCLDGVPNVPEIYEEYCKYTPPQMKIPSKKSKEEE